MKFHHRETRFILLILFCIGVLALPSTGTAVLFVVDDLSDLNDDNPADNDCITSQGTCTLRAAIQQINALGGSPNTIGFQPGTGGTIKPSQWFFVTASVTISGPGSEFLTIDGQNSTNLLVIESATDDRTVTVEKIRLTGGLAPTAAAGAVGVGPGDTLVLDRVVIESSVAPQYGGAIYSNGGTIEILRSRISNNEATADDGGGICVLNGTLIITDSLFDGNIAHTGGAVYTSGSDLTITDTVFENNTALIAGGIFAHLGSGNVFEMTDSSLLGNRALTSDGGGLYLFGLDGSAILQNVTIAGNTSARDGGGLYSVAGPPVVMANSTVSGNRAGRDGGGIKNGTPLFSLSNLTITGNDADTDGDNVGMGGGVQGNFRIENTIIAGNTQVNSTFPAPDCSGTLTSAGYNIIGSQVNCTITAGPGDQIGLSGAEIDPLLGAIAYNGGPSRTHPLLTGSPAIEIGNPGGCTWDDDNDGGASTAESILNEDQRGETRPFDVNCDAGAFEWTHCDNGAQDMGETGIDCGVAPCAACGCGGSDGALVGTGTYASVLGAYQSAWDGAVIRIRETAPAEILTSDYSKRVYLVGGYDCDFSRIGGFSSMVSLTVETGSVVVENLALVPL